MRPVTNTTTGDSKGIDYLQITFQLHHDSKTSKLEFVDTTSHKRFSYETGVAEEVWNPCRLKLPVQLAKVSSLQIYPPNVEGNPVIKCKRIKYVYSDLIAASHGGGNSTHIFQPNSDKLSDSLWRREEISVVNEYRRTEGKQED